jgi:mono/diheme cytochrome c family protein
MNPALTIPLAALVWVAAAAPARPAPPVPPQTVVPSADEGRRVYDDRKCAACHMVAGEGNARFPLDGVGRRLTRTQMRRWLTDPAAMERALPRLPAIRMSDWLARNRKINARDREALVAFLASLK